MDADADGNITVDEFMQFMKNTTIDEGLRVLHRELRRTEGYYAMTEEALRPLVLEMYDRSTAFGFRGTAHAANKNWAMLFEWPTRWVKAGLRRVRGGGERRREVPFDDVSLWIVVLHLYGDARSRSKNFSRLYI